MFSSTKNFSATETTARFEWKPERFDKAAYSVTAELLDGERVVDQIVHEMTDQLTIMPLFYAYGMKGYQRERIDVLFDPGTFTEIDTLVLPRYESYLGGKSSRPKKQ